MEDDELRSGEVERLTPVTKMLKTIFLFERRAMDMQLAERC